MKPGSAVNNYEYYKILVVISIFLGGTYALSAQWDTRFSGPGSALEWPYINFVAVADSNTVWATLANAVDPFSAREIIRTSDGGQNWIRNITPAADFNTYNINLFAQDSLIAWLARISIPEEDTTTIFKTVDGGASWTEQNIPFSNSVTVVIAIHFFNATDGFAYAETYNGTDWSVECYYTNNGGDNWAIASTPYLAGERVFIWHGNNNYAVQGDTVWFGTSLSRVFRSIDKGESWEAFSVPFYHTRMVESVAFLDADNGIVATALSDSLGGALGFNDALRTEDGGETWTRIPIPHESLMDDPRMMGLAAVPGTSGTYMLYGYRQTDFKYQQMITKDNGQTWYYVEDAESKIRCMQFISPTQGWGGGWNYSSPGTIEKMFKWAGPPLDEVDISSTNEWNKLQASISLFPNPASEEVIIEINNDQEYIFKLEVFDLSGNLIFSGQLQNQIPNILLIADWPKGAYVVKITGANGYTARTFIKQ